MIDYERNTDRGAAMGAFEDTAPVNVLHATFVAERDPATCFTLIVHSESMEASTIEALHEACLRAIKRVSAAHPRR